MHIWRDLFRVVELEEIIRQQNDREFAALLNRVRLNKPTDADLDVLQSRVISRDSEAYPAGSLHVLTQNTYVDTHNLSMLGKLPTERIVMNAIDRKKDLNTNRASVTNIPDDPAKTGGLVKSLILAVGAHVMLIRNIDVADGLVNRAHGQVVDFMKTNNIITAVLVKFNDSSVGCQLKIKHCISKSGAVPIFQMECRFQLYNKGNIDVTRKQFPLKLAFASTIHKVQGLSLDKIVASFDGSFKAGQAYVALSRARTLDGLYLLSFNRQKIKESGEVENEMKRLRTEMPLIYSSNPLVSLSSTKWLKICHLNARSLSGHREDFLTYQDLLSADVICVSETWLSNSSDEMAIPGFEFHHKTRQESYIGHRCLDEDQCRKCNSRGGVGVFVREGLQYQNLKDTSTNLESMVFSITKNEQAQYLAFYYRPEHVGQGDIIANVQSFLTRHHLESVTVLGDFNMDYASLSAQSPLLKIMEDRNMSQIISEGTHVSGSLLDHVYINKQSNLVQSGIIPCYFSDHNTVYAILPTPGDEKELAALNVPTQSNHNTSAQASSDRNVSRPKKLTRQVEYKSQHRCSKLQPQSKRKISEVSDVSKSVDEINVIPDIQILNVDDNKIFVQEFMLPTHEDQQRVMDILGLKIVYESLKQAQLYDVRYRGYHRTLQQHTSPCVIDAIEPDGNCFFRAISKQLFRTQKYHHRVRQFICNFEESHQNTFLNYYSGDQTFLEHVANKRHLRQWATEVELVATATFFNTSIFEFTEQFPVGSGWKWIEIKKVCLHPDDSQYDGFPIEGHFYLHHTWGIHYDCVFPVQQHCTNQH